MKILILNGSPRKNGATARLLKAMREGLEMNHSVEWVDVYKLEMKPCMGCLRCRPAGRCVLPGDDAHGMKEAIESADVLVVGTPTYWGNMSGPLKILFDRNVPAFEYIDTGFPRPRQKGKKAYIVTASASPWPFNQLMSQSRGAVRALKTVLNSGGYRVAGIINVPGVKKNIAVPERYIRKARRFGERA